MGIKNALPKKAIFFKHILVAVDEMMVGAISVAEQGVDREVYTSAQTPHIG